MQWFYLKTVQASVKTEWPQVIFLFSLVIFFSCNSIGLLEFRPQAFLWFNLKAEMLTNGSGEFMLPDIVSSAEFVCLVLSGLTLAFLLPILTPIAASSLVVFAAIPSLYLGIGLPLRNSLIPMQYSLLIILVLFGLNVLFNYFAETHKKQKLITTFGRYVPPEIVNTISKSPELVSLDGELKQLTIFFCDLKSFTGVSEQLDPKQLVSLLNEYFTVMTEVLYKHGGTIDKYIGDSIMAFWGAPLPQDDHASRAVLAATEMHQAIESLSHDFIERGLPGPTMGVGVNSGMVNVGNMGSKYRLAYTVIGDAVNLAARLESLTRVYQVPTIVGEETAKSATEIVFRELDTLAVKGKTQKTRIYQPICLKTELSEETAAFLKSHHEALASYYANDYEKAEHLFKQLQASSKQEYYYQHMLNKMPKVNLSC